MAINLNLEQERSLTTKQIYEIIDFSNQLAFQNGFLNSFVFQRALYLFAGIYLFPERKEEISTMISEDPMTAWDNLIEDGTIESMLEDYAIDMNMIADLGKTWFDEYNTYATSAIGILNAFQEFSGDIVSLASEKLKDNLDNSKISELLELGDKWGMNNSLY